ncbi:MAG: hypothetical protein ACKVRP_08340 [Bacteroidota bacterium]
MKSIPYRLRNIPAFFLVSLIVFVSRLPFINSSLGTDGDVYRVALTALSIASKGEYLFSRFPGFPVQEYVFSFLMGVPTMVFNMISALLSGLSAGMFTLILRRLKIENSILLGLALACTPVVFVNSTASLDYVWALAFIIASVWVLFQKPWLAGGLLGIAVGCRFTSLLMFAPLCVLLWKLVSISRIKSILQFLGGAFLTTCMVYTPVILAYQPGSTPQIPMQTNVWTSLYKASVGVWGIPGLVVLAGLAVTVLVSSKRKHAGSPVQEQHRGLLTVSLFAISLYALVFLPYPYEAGYLIPIVPWVLLIVGMHMNRTQIISLTGALLLSSFTFGIISANQPEPYVPSPLHVVLPVAPKALTVDVLKGPVCMEYERRETRRHFLDRMYAYADTVSQRTIVVTGWLTPQIRFEIGGGTERSNVVFAYALRANAIEFYKTNDYAIRYLRGMNEMNRQRYGVDLLEAGAVPLLFD